MLYLCEVKMANADYYILSLRTKVIKKTKINPQANANIDTSVCCPLTPVTLPTVQLCDWLTAESDVQTGTNGVRPQLQEQASIIRDYLLIHPVGVFPLWSETQSNVHRPV